MAPTHKSEADRSLHKADSVLTPTTTAQGLSVDVRSISPGALKFLQKMSAEGIPILHPELQLALDGSLLLL